MQSIYVLTDIDECAVNNGGCSQTCTNSAGEFQCSCLQGYESNDGGISCFGETLII